MISWIIRTLGLKGSWSWACRQMKQGKIIRPSTAVSVGYKLDDEGEERIIWSFKRYPTKDDWENAYLFLSDFKATDWVIAGKESTWFFKLKERWSYYTGW